MSVVYARCPVCGDFIPTFEVSATRKGWFKPHIIMEITNDATDWVAHMWAHRGGNMDLKDHWDEAYDLGFAAGLKAARAAVDATGVRKDTAWDMRMAALVVIDQLIEGE